MPTVSVPVLLKYDVDGVVLIGGQSKRMRQPKALLPYEDTVLFFTMAQKLEKFCTSVYLSHNPIHFTLPQNHYSVITDSLSHPGPMSGIISALTMLKKSVLVVPCDTPLVEEKDIQFLFDNRNAHQLCTVYYDEKNGYYEPLIGLWEYSALDFLQTAYEHGDYSLQHILKDHHITKHHPEDIGRLKNINTPEDYQSLFS